MDNVKGNDPKEIQEAIKRMEAFFVELQSKLQETRDNIIFLKGKLEGVNLKSENGNGTTKESIQKENGSGKGK